jgi:hypothetical protein
MSSILRRNGGAMLVGLGAVLACSTGEQTADRPAAASPARPCATPADSIIGLATVAFTKFITPKPHRYLIPVGTDSVLPDRAHWALQNTGATLNVWPRDTALQKKVKDQLGAKGAYTMLVVSYHGQRALPDGRTALDFSGTYMGGTVDGKVVPRTPIVFSCHAEGERFVVDTTARTP